MSLYDREGIENYERRAFYEQVEIEKEEILSCLRTVVSTWTENEIEAGNTPTFENFRNFYPEWDHEELYYLIAGEMNRIAAYLLGSSEAI